MHHILARTFGGLTPAYFLRQLFFGLLLTASIGFMLARHPTGVPAVTWLFLGVCTVLYPYARFVYESIVRFIVGQNLFLLPLPVMLATQLVTMVLCYAGALVIAPIGLAYLYVHHARMPRAAYAPE